MRVASAKDAEPAVTSVWTVKTPHPSVPIDQTASAGSCAEECLCCYLLWPRCHRLGSRIVCFLRNYATRRSLAIARPPSLKLCLVSHFRHSRTDHRPQYYGTLFKVAMLDGWLVVFTGPKLIDELRRSPEEELSANEGTAEVGSVHLLRHAVLHSEREGFAVEFCS